MNFFNYEKIFRLKAVKSGFSEEDIVSCLNYAKPLLDRKLPVIYNTANLAALVGYRTTYLKRAAKYTSYFYRKFSIRKKNGKTRELAEPLPSLKEIQDWILENILSSVKVSKYAKAYIKNKSLIDNVRYHKGRKAILTLDILNFFGSIKLHHVENIFSDLGYSSNISNLLAKLCTCDDSLPQGASTSPCLSNIYLNHFDAIVSSYCSKNDIRYTRYADDLTFSGTKEDLNIIGFIQTELFSFGLVLNETKSKIMERSQRQIVTGIVVNEKIQVPKDVRNFIRNEVHFLTKFGLKEHLTKTKNHRANYIEHLLGKINFVLHINPEDKRMQQYKIKVMQVKSEIQ